ncbi:hypothetical protein AVEN_203481-1 [Araneus ventricosus]|uniref:Uncharacterized protein n=1 Tax=Araneus ventricosus TaxID=182803 RepID=A0A4Y2BH01_ARAVE|nr:hypothetical protein AVEN_203481-1 [Araneus ventricosus]
MLRLLRYRWDFREKRFCVLRLADFALLRRMRTMYGRLDLHASGSEFKNPRRRLIDTERQASMAACGHSPHVSSNEGQSFAASITHSTDHVKASLRVKEKEEKREDE